MKKDNNTIPIQNIYYMICYAWDILIETDKQNKDTEQFDNIYNLLSKILIDNLTVLIKRGFYKSYINYIEELSNVRGKIDINKTVKYNLFAKKKLVCQYDELSTDIYLNQMINYTIKKLLKCNSLHNKYVVKLKEISNYFLEVGEKEPTKENISKITYNKNNRHYRVIINICILIYEGLITKEKEGNIIFSEFIKDEKMASLYENFVLNFYRKNLNNTAFYYPVSNKIKWDLTYETSNDVYLPEMITDIVLRKKNNESMLIIDTKFYKDALKSKSTYSSKKLYSPNLYQIYAYINNVKNTNNVSGMLLYPTTTIDLDLSYLINNKYILIKTINLNQSWIDIEKRLLDIGTNW